jgi:hypothetical protein
MDAAVVKASLALQGADVSTQMQRAGERIALLQEQSAAVAASNAQLAGGLQAVLAGETPPPDTLLLVQQVSC